ncbi:MULTISPECIES: N-acyl-D-amino-acid deacylase family protein [Henriciella]|jgi:N-acyl-D-aspartate/D-glutamate deacylase|uniref:Amidohydrolase n=1 Tax=Henriciella pelagia TaxID=1977912 RepID=A0ABQ1JRM4_9PROT|nr:amidohydrolase family protein [Henriciella pelagia]GGB75141.1 amidohydrolase [Henriciella pelagia]
MTHDLVIRNGFVVDGTGAPGRDADIAIDAGRITAIGQIAAKAREEIDARGELVTPGFVDVHTHYDGQVTWGDTLTPSSVHGVTTAVMGNCGVGFAPCREADRDRLIRLMEGVEDIPFPVLSTGLPWDWQSFPEYLDSLSGKAFDIDFAAQLPHAALRVYVMGERGANREDATNADIAEMARLAKAAVEAGALGFSTSRTLNHRTSDGQPTPTLTASEAELTGIAMALKDAGKGVLQFVSDFNDPKKEAAMLRRIVEASGRPLSVSLAQSDVAPEGWRALLGAIEEAVDDGLPMRAQVCGRPVGVLLGLDLTMNPFTAHPVYQEIKDKTLDEQVAALRDPDFRARLLASKPDPDNPFVQSLLRQFGKLFVLDAVPDYEPTTDRTVEAIAKQRGLTNEEVALDILLEDDGRGMLYLPFLNYAQGSLDPSYEMLNSRATIPGLSDGGAHVGMICDGSFPTTMLTHWTRDRSRGDRFAIESVIKMQTADTAHWMGLHDRGLLQPGYRADLNIIDYDSLTLHRPEIIRDLPAGGRRLMQKATGYTATIVAGQTIYRDGTPTGAKPGRIVRGAQHSPAISKIAAE